jgi:glycosyltransferase involved in cell wall biosynthesis
MAFSVFNNKASSKNSGARQPGGTLLMLLDELRHDLWSAALIDLAAAVNRSGLSVIIMTPGGPQAAEAERRGLRVLRQPLPENFLQKLWGQKRLNDLITSERVSAVLAFTPAWLPLLLNAPRGQGLAQALHFAEPQINPQIIHQLEQFTTRGGQLLTPTKFMQRYADETLPVSDEALHYIAPGIELADFNAAQIRPERAAALSNLWRVPENSSLILHVGPLAPEFGMQTLIEALGELKRRDFYAVLLGDRAIATDEAQQLQQLVTQHGMQGKIIAPEPCQDWPAAFWLANIVVAANQLPVGHNPALLAAQAMGRPLIVSDAGANLEKLLLNETTWNFAAGDSVALAAQLQRGLELKTADYARIAARGQHYAQQQYPYQPWLDAMTTQARELCKSALSQGMRVA